MNKRKHAKSIPLTAIIISIVFAICVVSFFVKGLMVKYQVVQGGEKLKRLEGELSKLAIANDALQNELDLLTSPPKLKLALESERIDLDPIDEKSVVNVGRPVSVDVAANISAVREEGR